MMPCNAMMILLCPPAPTLHQLPQLHRNVVQQVTRSPPSSPPRPCCRHRHPYRCHHLTSNAAIATEAPLSPNKKDEEGKKL